MSHYFTNLCSRYNEDSYVDGFPVPRDCSAFFRVVLNNVEGFQHARCSLSKGDGLLNDCDFLYKGSVVLQAGPHNKDDKTIDIYVIKTFVYLS